MTLAARLSTQVNLGKVETIKAKLSATFGNIALTQVDNWTKKKRLKNSKRI